MRNVHAHTHTHHLAIELIDIVDGRLPLTLGLWFFVIGPFATFILIIDDDIDCKYRINTSKLYKLSQHKMGTSSSDKTKAPVWRAPARLV